jgi:hypothetical protein
LRIGEGAGEGIGGSEAGGVVAVEAGQGVIVVRFRVALVGCKFPFGGGAGFVLGFAPSTTLRAGSRKVAEGAGDVGAGIGGEADGEMIGVLVGGGAAGDSGEKLGTGIDVLARGRRGSRAVVVFGDHFATGENIHGGGAAGGTNHAEAVTVKSIGAGISSVRGADHAILRVVSQRVGAVEGHVAGES